jgi:hypothetical protein
MPDYNGWTNYETWNIKLWMDNAESIYHYWEEKTKQAATIKELADALKEYYDENIPEDVVGSYLDILTAALEEVNWREIAESLWEEWREEDTAEGEEDEAV